MGVIASFMKHITGGGTSGRTSSDGRVTYDPASVLTSAEGQAHLDAVRALKVLLEENSHETHAQEHAAQASSKSE